MAAPAGGDRAAGSDRGRRGGGADRAGGGHARGTARTVTPAVHYVRFGFTPAQVAAFAGPRRRWRWWPAHPDYEARTELTPACVSELLGDLLGTTKPLPYRLTRGRFFV